MYLQEGRFSATVGSKKHPELPGRNPKRAVPKNRHIISLPRSDGEIQIPALDGEILSGASPDITESSIPIREPQRQKAKSNRKFERKFSVRRIAQLRKMLVQTQRKRQNEEEAKEERKRGKEQRDSCSTASTIIESHSQNSFACFIYKISVSKFNKIL